MAEQVDFSPQPVGPLEISLKSALEGINNNELSECAEPAFRLAKEVNRRGGSIEEVVNEHLWTYMPALAEFRQITRGSLVFDPSNTAARNQELNELRLLGADTALFTFMLCEKLREPLAVENLEVGALTQQLSSAAETARDKERRLRKAATFQGNNNHDVGNPTFKALRNKSFRVANFLSSTGSDYVPSEWDPEIIYADWDPAKLLQGLSSEQKENIDTFQTAAFTAYFAIIQAAQTQATVPTALKYVTKVDYEPDRRRLAELRGVHERLTYINERDTDLLDTDVSGATLTRDRDTAIRSEFSNGSAAIMRALSVSVLAPKIKNALRVAAKAGVLGSILESAYAEGRSLAAQNEDYNLDSLSKYPVTRTLAEQLRNYTYSNKYVHRGNNPVRFTAVRHGGYAALLAIKHCLDIQHPDPQIRGGALLRHGATYISHQDLGAIIDSTAELASQYAFDTLKPTEVVEEQPPIWNSLSEKVNNIV